MYTLYIEHGIKDFTQWKAAFDRDPLDRAASGVKQFRVGTSLEDARYVLVEMDFERAEQAADMVERLHATVWSSPVNAPALQGAPKTRIAETVYTGTY